MFKAIKDILKVIIDVIALAIFGFGCGWFGWQFCLQRTEYRQATAEEQIRYLESQGYDCGWPKDVPGPKFCRALTKWECDKYARPYFEPQIAQINTDSK